jgi:PAS domain S-box-containing protein
LSQHDEAEHALSRIEARSGAYLQAALDCVVMVDASGCIVEFNPAAERTFGHARDEVLGRPLAELIVPPSLRERHNRAFARFVETGEGRLLGRRLELTGMRADGSEFPVELALSRVEGEPLLVCGALRDLSEPKRAEDDLRRLAQEQGALRRVATRVARAATPAEVFAAVAEEIAKLFHVPFVAIDRAEPDGTSTVIGAWGSHPFSVGTRWPLEGDTVTPTVFRTGRPARVNMYSGLPGSAAEAARAVGARSAVGVPIVVDGEVWGVVAVGSNDSVSLPAETEARLADFTELLATAISNAQARDDLRRLAHEQAALRRVATLVAREATPGDVFPAVAEELARILDVPLISMLRYDGSDPATLIGAWGDSPFPVGSRWPLDSRTILAAVARTGRPARIDDYTNIPGEAAAAIREAGIRSAVGAPIIVEDNVWGVFIALTRDVAPLPPQTERRLADFAELVATAISNAQARDDVRRLAHEQAALRRVATLVAQRAPPAEVFATVMDEVGNLLEADLAQLYRYEDGGTAVLYVASWSRDATTPDYPPRLTLEGRNLGAIVRDTGKPARIDDYWAAPGAVADQLVRPLGIRAGIGCPVIVDGKLWGVMAASTRKPEPFPPGAEARLAGFTELVATAISNADTHAALIASRARIVTAADEARRRVERDLHDGTQQRLVSLGLDLQTMQAKIPAELPELGAELARATEGLEEVLDDVREISRGLHPATLSQAGLASALKALARRTAVPVELDVAVEGRLPPSIEVAVYFVVSEALANAAKHANASVVYVTASISEGWLHATVRDDGVGGAVATAGSGLLGLEDRVEALGGRFLLSSSAREGTVIAVRLPLTDAAG